MKKLDKNRFRKIYSRFRAEKRVDTERSSLDIIEGGLTNFAERFVLDSMLAVIDVASIDLVKISEDFNFLNPGLEVTNTEFASSFFRYSGGDSLTQRKFIHLILPEISYAKGHVSTKNTIEFISSENLELPIGFELSKIKKFFPFGEFDNSPLFFLGSIAVTDPEPSNEAVIYLYDLAESDFENSIQIEGAQRFIDFDATLFEESDILLYLLGHNNQDSLILIIENSLEPALIKQVDDLLLNCIKASTNMIFGAGNNFITVSNDYGQTWNDFIFPEEDGVKYFEHCDSSENGLESIFVGQQGTVTYSLDYGTTWQHIDFFENKGIDFVDVKIKSSLEWHLFSKQGIYITSNYGQSWKYITNQNFNSEFVSIVDIEKTLIDPDDLTGLNLLEIKAFLETNEYFLYSEDGKIYYLNTETFIQNRWVGLFKQNPGEESDISSEVNGAGYSRKLVQFDISETVNDVTVSSNSSTVTFSALGDWGTVNYIGIFDSDGPEANLIWYGNLDSELQVLNTDQIVFNIGSIIITID